MILDRYNELAAELLTFANAARELQVDTSQSGRWATRGVLDLVVIDGKHFVTRESVSRLKAARDANPQEATP